MFPNCATSEDLLKAIKDEKVQMIDLRFTDLPGVWQHFSVPPSAVSVDALEEGIGFDGSSIRGFQEIQESDMLVVPDPTTAFLDPFSPATTLVLICNIRDPVTGQSYSRDARYIAQKAETYLKGTGQADKSYFGPEAEFFVFNDVRYGQDINFAFHEIDSSEGSWNTGKDEEPNLGHKPRPKEGYFPVPPTDSMQALRTEMVLTMESLGIAIEAHHHEVATGGQNEIDMRFTTLTRMADNLMMYKYVVKNTARQHGMTTTFMPKPLFEDNASGMRALRPDHELLSPSGAGLRSSDQSGLFPAQSLSLLPNSDVFAESAGKAGGVSFAGSIVQSLPGLRRDADGRP
jgi:glutamine synthetase